MQTDTETLAEIVSEACASFETATRSDGESYTRRKDDSAGWIRDLCYAAHDGMMPDDWRYETIRAALDYIDESALDSFDDLSDLAHEFADSRVDIYNSARLDWLSSNLTRSMYCDEAAQEFGGNLDTFERIGVGQYAEALEVFESVRASLEDRAEDLAAE